MKLNIDKRIIKAGDVIEVAWDAEQAESPRLVIHTGAHETTLSIPDSGSKKFRIKATKGQHWIGLRCMTGKEDKLDRRRFFVCGKMRESDAFEYVDKTDRWGSMKEKCKRFWNSFSAEKKRLYGILLALLAYQGLMSFQLYTASQILMTILTFYIFWMVVRRN